MINEVFSVNQFSCASDGTSKKLVLSKINEQIKKKVTVLHLMTLGIWQARPAMCGITVIDAPSV